MNFEKSRRELQADQNTWRQLAVPSVAVQGAINETYHRQEALAEGTMFPELNLPFHLMVKGAPVPESPLTQLQALSFVVTELGLYLDTHPKDEEAFRLFQNYVKLEKEAKARYVKEHGPIVQRDAASDDTYTWLKDPWPWNKRKED